MMERLCRNAVRTALSCFADRLSPSFSLISASCGVMSSCAGAARIRRAICLAVSSSMVNWLTE